MMLINKGEDDLAIIEKRQAATGKMAFKLLMHL